MQTRFDENLGGRNFDLALLKYIQSNFLRKDFDQQMFEEYLDNKINLLRSLNAVEKARIELSSQN